MSDLGVMGSLLVRSRFVVLCGFAVVLGRFIMVMRGFLMMLGNVVVGHLNLPVLEVSTVALRHDIVMTIRKLHPDPAIRSRAGKFLLATLLAADVHSPACVSSRSVSLSARLVRGDLGIPHAQSLGGSQRRASVVRPRQ
jgi:hypothetical protein